MDIFHRFIDVVRTPIRTGAHKDLEIPTEYPTKQQRSKHFHSHSFKIPRPSLRRSRKRDKMKSKHAVSAKPSDSSVSGENNRSRSLPGLIFESIDDNAGKMQDINLYLANRSSKETDFCIAEVHHEDDEGYLQSEYRNNTDERSQTLDPLLSNRRQGSRFNIYNTSGSNLQPSPLTFEPGRPLHRMIRTTPIGTPKSPQKISIVQSTYNSANNSPTTIHDRYHSGSANNSNNINGGSYSPTRNQHQFKLKLQHEDSNDSCTGSLGLRLQKSGSSCGSTDDDLDLNDAIQFNNLQDLLPVDIPDVTISISDSPYGSTDGLDKQYASDLNGATEYKRLPSNAFWSSVQRNYTKVLSKSSNNSLNNCNGASNLSQDYSNNHTNSTGNNASSRGTNNLHHQRHFSNNHNSTLNHSGHQSDYYKNDYNGIRNDDYDELELNRNLMLSNFSFNSDDLTNISKCTAV